MVDFETHETSSLDNVSPGKHAGRSPHHIEPHQNEEKERKEEQAGGIDATDSVAKVSCPTHWYEEESHDLHADLKEDKDAQDGSPPKADVPDDESENPKNAQHIPYTLEVQIIPQPNFVTYTKNIVPDVESLPKKPVQQLMIAVKLRYWYQTSQSPPSKIPQLKVILPKRYFPEKKTSLFFLGQKFPQKCLGCHPSNMKNSNHQKIFLQLFGRMPLRKLLMI